MAKRIVILQGHPDPSPARLCQGLADAYAAGARTAGHAVEQFGLATLGVPLLTSRAEFYEGEVPPALRPVQMAIGRADHLVVVYPLWLGDMPALLKAFFEQVFRPDFAFERDPTGRSWKRRLTGRSARVVVTMGMPALAYRWYFGAHSLKSLQRNILGFSGFSPVKSSLYGGVETADAARRAKWLDEQRMLGREAR